MAFLTKVEDLHNRASDTRFVWFPFLWMKPKAHETLRFRKLAMMSFFFGLYYGVFFTLRSVLKDGSDFLVSLPQDILFAIVIFFVWFNLVTAPLWNRRAKRLVDRTLSQRP